jgi:hypothetical protein
LADFRQGKVFSPPTDLHQAQALTHASDLDPPTIFFFDEVHFPIRAENRSANRDIIPAICSHLLRG